MPTARASSLYQNLLAGTYADGTAFESALTDSATRGAWRELVGSCTEMLKAFTADTNATNILEDVIMASQTARRDAASGPAANEAWASSLPFTSAILGDATAIGYVFDDVKCLIHWFVQSGMTCKSLLISPNVSGVLINTNNRFENFNQAAYHPQSKLRRQYFTSNGTWYMPIGVPVLLCRVLAIGAGGGGGGSGGNVTGGGGGGGGGGQVVCADVQPTGDVTVTIGAYGSAGSAGPAGNNGVSGGSGGSTSFGSMLSAAGGSGGGGSSGSTPGGSGSGGASGTPSGNWSSLLYKALAMLGVSPTTANLSGGNAGGGGTGGSGWGGGGGGGGGAGGGNGSNGTTGATTHTGGGGGGGGIAASGAGGGLGGGQGSSGGSVGSNGGGSLFALIAPSGASGPGMGSGGGGGSGSTSAASHGGAGSIPGGGGGGGGGNVGSGVPGANGGIGAQGALFVWWIVG